MTSGDSTRDADATRARPSGSRARRVGPYRIEGELGRGGMGVVYRAFDERLQRDVALKALPPELAHDPAERARLEREARAMARVSHPNVASIHGLEESAGTLYLVLELVPGKTLREHLDAGPFPVVEAITVGAGIAAGLSAVHGKGLVHHDLTPGNVMITPDGAAKLLDFGLARRAREAGPGAPARLDEISGTPGWMSPEQVRGEELDGRSDTWAWGCLLFACLTGQRPFPGETWAERDAATLAAEPDWSLLPAGAPVALLRACLSKDRADRPQSVDEVRRLLEDALQTSSARRAAAELPKHRLPADRDAFVGRADELEDLTRLLDAGHRLVSILGVGGSGKTRLALQHAHRALPSLPGGAWFCDLAEARSPDGIASAVAVALDVPLGQGDPITRLGHALAGRGRCLVILDNFEQVARHADATLGRWLDRAPEAAFVVTTREILGLRGEQAFALGPLRQRDAEALFVARAQAARRDFDPDEAEREQVRRLLVLLDHLPLAIELAAARCGLMPPRVLLERMSQRFKLLSSSGARVTRQATLRATFDWSWELLSADERAALAQLSVFEGGFTLEAAEGVLALDELWPADAVQALLNKSWVRMSGDRFDLLVSVREYAAERLEAISHAGGSDAAARAGSAELSDGRGEGAAGSARSPRSAAEVRHGEHFAALGSQEALEAAYGHDAVTHRRALARELDNLIAACRRAIARGDGRTAAATQSAAWEVLRMRGPYGVAAELAREALALSSLDVADRARLLRALGGAAYVSGSMEEAQASFESALALRPEGKDAAGTSAALDALGLIDWSRGRLDEARARFEESLSLAREAGSRKQEAVALDHLGIQHWSQGRLDDAATCMSSALAVFRELGNRHKEGETLGNIGIVESARGRPEEMRACYESALAIAREVGNRGGEGVLLSNLALVYKNDGRPDEARACFEAAVTIHREMGHRGNEAAALANLGETMRAEGRLDEARACCESALTALREVGDRRLEGWVLGILSDLHADRGLVAESRACVSQAEALLRQVGDRVGVGLILCRRAVQEHEAGELAAASATLAEAESIARAAGAGEHSELGQALAQARVRLGGDASGGA